MIGDDKVSDSKTEILKGMCVVDITKYLMKKKHWTADIAYLYLMQMELYQILMDTESGLCLEQDEYLFQCCDAELEGGADAFYDFIEAV